MAQRGSQDVLGAYIVLVMGSIGVLLCFKKFWVLKRFTLLKLYEVGERTQYRGRGVP